jgi:tRNA-specific 2-thiouridylase
MRGPDSAKDQSYFLWAAPKDALAHTLFPVGSMHKADTRALAKRFNLPVSAKKDSQGICFLGSISVEDFLRAELGPEPGIAEDARGKQVGTHGGAVLHTLGERVALEDAAPGPWFVVGKDMGRNALIVSHEQKAMERERSSIMLRETNWLEETVPGEILEAQYRYHGPRIEGRLSEARDAFIPARPLERPIAEGQSLVIYRGETLVGGGIIR